MQPALEGVRKCRIPKRAAKYWGPLLLASLEQVDEELDESVSSCGSASAVSAVRLFSSRRVRPCGPFISADTLQVKTWRSAGERRESGPHKRGGRFGVNLWPRARSWRMPRQRASALSDRWVANAKYHFVRFFTYSHSKLKYLRFFCRWRYISIKYFVNGILLNSFLHTFIPQKIELWYEGHLNDKIRRRFSLCSNWISTISETIFCFHYLLYFIFFPS